MAIAAGEYGLEGARGSFVSCSKPGHSTCCKPTPLAASRRHRPARLSALCEAYRSVALGALRAGAAPARRGCHRAPGIGHVEWFHDHARVEHLLLDGAPEPVAGAINPDRSRPGNGLALRKSDAERYAV